jgi:heme o synthase
VKPNFRLLRGLLLTSAILVYLTIVLGGIVRASGSSGACLEWPACYGQWLPPRDPNALIDYTHRLTSLLSIPLVLGAAILAWRGWRNEPLISLSLFAALALLGIQAIFGGAVAGLSGKSVQHLATSVHLGLSLLIQAGLLAASVAIFYRQSSPLAYRTPFARFSLLTLFAIFILLVSGAVVSATGSGQACASWPLCGGSLIPSTPNGWIQMSHRIIVGATSLLVGILLIQAWRTQRSAAPALVSSTAVAALFFAQALMGGYSFAHGSPAYMISLHEGTAVAAWAAMVVQVISVGMTRRTVEDEQADAASIIGRKGLARDFLMLTKPVVVALLLVTTFAGMVIGKQAWPSFTLAFWTLLGGAMAAGGSGAINQYIDRNDDGKMQRTEKRPLPAGRLTPGEALAFGMAMCISSFYLTVAFVNLLAALLVLAGIIYYVLLYSIFLKKATVQNIVIGGGAGAIPPLVGWAAATGSLNFPSLFLFAVVFMWTPPHFWSLALVRRKDYARAGVPMLPVVRGERETRWQILIYTLELVGLSLLLPVFGLGKGLYIVAALALGGLLLVSAWRVWKKGGNKTAWKMYRYSSMYLAFLFFALMADRLLFLR